VSRVPLLLLLAALVLLGLGARLSTPRGPAPDVPLLEPGSAEAEQDAWRLRLVELGLTSGRAPRNDRFLDAPQGRPAPWPPLYHAALAALARHTVLRDRDAFELGALESREVLELAARLVPWLGALGVLAAFLTARALHGGSSADVAGLGAAALWALAPSIVFAEHAGRLDPHGLAALLAFGLVGATSFALRAREDVDATLGGLVAGVAGGLGLACSADGAVVLVGCLAAFGWAAWRDRPGARRALLLMAVVCTLTATMSIGRDAAWSALLPVRVGWAGSGAVPRHWLVAVVGPAALVALALGWSWRVRPATVVLLLTGLAWAAAVGPGAAGVEVVVVLAASVATADLHERLPARRRALAPLALALGAAPALAFRPPDPLRPEHPEELAAWREGLRWMRSQDPSPDPWSHPEARPAGWVLTAPGFGAGVAAGARRAVLSAAPPGLRVNRVRAREAAELLAGPADAAQVEALRVLGVDRVVVAPRMRDDPWLAGALGDAAGPTLFDALIEGAGAPPGVERLWPSGPGVASLAVWRVDGSAGRDAPPTVRPR
jgi:hypothetical protein